MGEAVTEDAPEAQGAKAAIEDLGATPVMCDRVEFKRRQARCGKQPIDAAVVLQFFPAEPFTAPERLVKDGFAIVVLEAPSEEAPTDGRVRLRTDIMAAGLEEGRAAGAWAASAWPDSDVVAAIQPVAAAPDPSSTRSRKDSSSPSRRPRSSRSRPTRWSRSTRTCTPVPSWVAWSPRCSRRQTSGSKGDRRRSSPSPARTRCRAMSGSPAASTSAMRTSARRLSMSSRDSARAARSRPRSMVGPIDRGRLGRMKKTCPHRRCGQVLGSRTASA